MAASRSRETDPERPDLDAGDFTVWLAGMLAALHGDADSDVPCGTCTACCTASQFIHIGPDETDTLAHIPAELLFPAPRLPRGHVLLGYDEQGHCPMLIDDQCSIYAHRPRTCRTYDCRVFPATGVHLDHDDDKALIDQQARRWRFDLDTPDAVVHHEAARAAAAFVAARAEELAPGTAPANATQHAVLAIEVHAAFLGRDEATGAARVIEPEPPAVQAELRARSRRDPS